MASKRKNYLDPKEFYNEVTSFLVQREQEKTLVEFYKILLKKHIKQTKTILNIRLEKLDELSDGKYTTIRKIILIKRREINEKTRYLEKNHILLSIKQREELEYRIVELEEHIESLEEEQKDVLFKTNPILYKKYLKTKEKFDNMCKKEVYLENYTSELEIPDRLYEMIYLLCIHNARDACWNRYPFTEDMIKVALLQVVEKLDYFDYRREGANPFFYFTSVVRNEYRRMIKREKREEEKKDKMLNIFDEVQRNSGDDDYIPHMKFYGC